MNMNEPPQVHAGLRNFLPICIVAGLFLVVLGCDRNTGPARYELTGKVTYAGQPVPAGYIIFAPDTSTGNDGPGASVEIKEGAYRVPQADGTVGGPHIVTINGFDGVSFGKGLTINPMGLPIFTDVQISVDLPKESSTHDFVVPAQTAK